MLSLSLAALLFTLVGSSLRAVSACPDDDHSHAPMRKRAFPSIPLPVPTRPLEWGDVNIIHTTDSHGWLLGHQKPSLPEPNYSADFGDFASFVAHMKEIAKEKDVDLLLIDSGDLHDGTGLSDGYPAGGVDGHDSNQFFAQLPYDVLAIGNHELYIYNVTLDVHTNFAPKFPGRYLSSNVNITVNNASVPVGERFAKFTTAKGRKVTSLGVIFDFTGNDEGTTVQTVADMVKEQWFADAIEEEPDFFLLVGHMPVSKGDWPLVFNAVRAVHPTTPILVLGGHTHIRDCVQFDGRSIGLESGRFMETIGWMSANLGKANSTDNLTFSRRYLDSNRVSFEYHTNTSNSTFDTSMGQEVTSGLNDLFARFDLGNVLGTAPQDYLLSRAPYPSNNSIISLLSTQVLPVALAVNNSRASIPNYIVVQGGGVRYDIFEGTFNKNDELTASPFTNAFVFLPNISVNVASQVLSGLNGGTVLGRRELSASREDREYARGNVDARYRDWVARMAEYDALEKRDTENLTLGYVTKDSCPGVGDDIPHTAVQSFKVPNFVASNPPEGIDPNAPVVDFVFTDFVQENILELINRAQNATTYTDADVSSYSPCELNCVFGVFAQQVWN